MASMTQIQTWLFGNRPFHVQIVGGDEAGKTKLLCTLKNSGKPSDETFSSLASYNREVIRYPLGWEFNIVAVHVGCSPFMLRHGQFHFMTPQTLVWLVHDCTSTETVYLRESMQAMKSKGPKFLWVIMSKQDLLPPDERERIVSEHRQMLEAILKKDADPAGITWFLVDTPGFNLKSGNFARPFLKDVAATIMSLDKERELKYERAKDDAVKFNMPGVDELRARIEASEIKSAGDFWEVFTTADLTSWKHVDHLQAGYLVMLQSIEQGHGLLKCASTFLEHLARLRETRPDVFRNSAHFTMTAFWIIQLRIAAFNFQYDVNSGIVPTGDDFRSVLLNMPTLLHTRLWMIYYTQEVLFTPNARTDFVMPDIKPFPQVTKPLLKALTEGEDDLNEAEPHLDVEAQQDIIFTGPERLPRWAFCLVQNVLSTGVRRGKKVKDALALLQTDTIRLRTGSQQPRIHGLAEGHGAHVAPYSETQAYFWVQLVHSRLAALSMETKAESLTYERFKEVCAVYAEAWKEYYSEDLWESVGARLEFVIPDKKALPNALGVLEA